MSTDPLVNLEVCLECDVKEILPSGEEIYIEPPTFTEKMSLNNMKITNEETVPDNYHVKKLEAIRKDLKLAHQEILVLRDFLKICCSGGNYVSLTHLTDSPNVLSNNSVFDFNSRKHALEKAHSILMEGYYKLTSNQMAGKFERSCELLKLRNNWSLKKSKEGIVGDLELSDGSGRQTSFKIESKNDGILSVSLPPGLRHSSSLRIRPTGISEITVDLISAAIDEDVQASVALSRAQTTLFFEDMFRFLAREGANIGDKILLHLNTQYSSQDSYLFKTLEFVTSLLFLDRISNNREGSGPLLSKISTFATNCLRRVGLIEHLRGTVLSDNVKLSYVCDNFESLHCVRVCVVMSLTNVPHQNKIHFEIRDGKMDVITVRGRLIEDFDDVEKLIDQQSLLYKYEILTLIGNKFGFVELSMEDVSDELKVLCGDEMFLFNRGTANVIFILNGRVKMRAFIKIDNRHRELPVEKGFRDNFVYKIESIFINLIIIR